MPGFNSRYRLCELFGIPLYLDFSLILLLLFFVTGGGSFASGIMCAIMLLVSITAHELGHALTARSFGYDTKDITLSLLGGCASLIALPRKASQEFLTAIAGPAVSFALSTIGALGISLVAAKGSFGDACGFVLSDALSSFGIRINLGGELLVRHDSVQLIQTLAYFSIMNAMLGLFNLLPGFPLDGGRIFRSAMRRFMDRAQATNAAMIVGRVVAVGIGLKGLFSIFNGGNWGFVTLMIAWMIWKEGYREYLMARREEDFRNWSQDDFSARVSPPPYDR